MARNRFQTTRAKKIDLSDGDWVEVKETLGWEESQPLLKRFKAGDTQAIIDLLKLVVLNWSFSDGENVVPYTPENLNKLELKTVEELAPFLMALYLPEKKSSQTSEQSSQEIQK